MCEIKKRLMEISEKHVDAKSLSTYIYNKGNAKLGDALVNFIYSLAKTIVSGIPTGVKVADSILTEAYKGSLWRKNKTLSITGDKGRVADAIEALILYFWTYEELTINDLVNPIIEYLEPESFHHPREEYSSAVFSFQNLLDNLYQKFIKANLSKNEKNSHNLE